MKFVRNLLATTVFAALGQLAHSETVAIDYVLTTSEAVIDPFTVPNPQGGADITIAPSITFDTGTFDAQFFNADAVGSISDGGGSILGLQLDGSLQIELSSTVDVFGFPVPVNATISGPLIAQQQSPSAGTLAGLSVYAETDPGNYDVQAGPLDCSDSAFGVFCGAIETALGIEFPIAGLGGASDLPFAAGTFTDLNPASSSPGSSVSAEIDFSFPLTDDINFGVDLQSNWSEADRVLLVPEPSAGLLLLTSVLAMISRRRRVSR